MKRVSTVISTYTADVSGVCSALFELGGMVVMHDPSGCNSTYNTHDEPRWYDQDSLIFISGLTQMDAIMGNDEKLIRDVARAARDLKPAFIALVRTPVPLMAGTDFFAVADLIREETGLPTWYFPTTGMASYVSGAGMAFETVAREMILPAASDKEKLPDHKDSSGKIGINLLGATPLDLSVKGTLESVIHFLRENEMEVLCSLGMDSPALTGDLADQLERAHRADVNLVLSETGLPAAKLLEQELGIPYVVGLPVSGFGEDLIDAIRTACAGKENVIACREDPQPAGEGEPSKKKKLVVIGETVYAQSLLQSLKNRRDLNVEAICPLSLRPELLGSRSLSIRSEEEIQAEVADADIVVADPMYRPICPKECLFIPVPHEAFSGRTFRRDLPDLVTCNIFQKHFPGNYCDSQTQVLE